ncbi:MAG: carbohydrate ABC transporter permease [Saccharospirillaceae bacterium]|nr:ABC transporter permease subunit [Pseudomonadales bacterium]NRB78467.1 carbohydrate ABC transporter permease [Saccharospirillaceae bacterium]
MNYFFKRWAVKMYMALFLFVFCWMLNQPLLSILTQLLDSIKRHDLVLELYLQPEYISGLLVSLKVSVLGGFFAAIFCSLVAYALAVFEFRFKKIILLLMLIILCTPFTFQLVPLIIGTLKLGLINQHIALWLPFVTPILGVFIIKQFIETIIDSELIEAARMEGASEWYLFYKIIIPLIKPAMVLIFLIQFSFIWYLFFYPLIMIPDESIQPLSMMAGGFRPMGDIPLGNMIFTMVPVLITILCSGYIYKFIKSDIA